MERKSHPRPKRRRSFVYSKPTVHKFGSRFIRCLMGPRIVVTAANHAKSKLPPNAIPDRPHWKKKPSEQTNREGRKASREKNFFQKDGIAHAYKLQEYWALLGNVNQTIEVQDRMIVSVGLHVNVYNTREVLTIANFILMSSFSCLIHNDNEASFTQAEIGDSFFAFSSFFSLSLNQQCCFFIYFYSQEPFGIL